LEALNFREHIKKIRKRIGRVLFVLGINWRRPLQWLNLRRYMADRRAWKRMGGVVHHTYPIVSDYTDSAGEASGQYFHQDLLVAQMIFQDAPKRHIDVASRIDGFVAHVASFREIEVFDIRPMDDSPHENIKFVQQDLMQDLRQAGGEGVTDSLSCLHALEHFGLGRYGDDIDPQGHLKGFANIVRMVAKGGTFYVSVVIGLADETAFNAHRIFAPTSILGWGDAAQTLALTRFDWVDDAGDLHTNATPEGAVGKVTYGLGIYTFKKLE
jgi:hypothetical protein